jgi:RNA polymerase sigma-70 factor (ECF subfamily)
MAVLAPDVTWTADSGGKATAARRPVVGAKKVAAVLTRFFQFARDMADVRFELTTCNFAPAIVVYQGDVFEGVFLIEITGDRITNFYAMRNPDKLVAFTPRVLAR